MVANQDGAEKAQIPRRLWAAITKIQLENDSDWDTACLKVAILTDTNSTAFKDLVEKESLRKYKSKHFTEMNKTMQSQKQEWYTKGYLEGSENETHFSLPCKKCGKDMDFTDFGENWPQVKQVLEGAFKDWSHIKCPDE
jgi:hypothetical protein